MESLAKNLITIQTELAKKRRLPEYLNSFAEDNYGQFTLISEAIESYQDDLEKPFDEFLKTGKGDRLLDALSKAIESYAIAREQDWQWDNPEPVEEFYFPRTL